MLELLQYLELESHLKRLIPSASNFLIIAYALVCIHNQKAISFLVAFLCVEVFTYISLTDGIDPVLFWFVIASVYCLLYYYATRKSMKFKIIVGCAIMITLDAGMAIDAKIYPKTETFLYSNHIWFAICAHVYCIIALIQWTLLRVSFRKSIDGLVHFLRDNYNVAFLLYNVTKAGKDKGQ